MLGEDDINVDSEKTNRNSLDVRATGGTCEFMGRPIPGAAMIKLANVIRQNRIIMDFHQEWEFYMMGTQKIGKVEIIAKHLVLVLK